MSRQEVLRHRGSYLYLRQDTLAICENDPCAALLLDLMEFWTSCRINDVRRAKEINKFMEPGKKIPVPDYWFFEKICDLQNHIYNVYGKTKIGASLAFLKEKGFIEDKPSPIHAFLKTKLYRLVTENVQNALDLFWAKSSQSELTTTLDSDLQPLAESESVLPELKTVLAESESASHLIYINSQYISSLSQGEPPATAVPQTPSPTHEGNEKKQTSKAANQQEVFQVSPTQAISSLVSSESKDPNVEATNPNLDKRVSTAPRENDSHFQGAPQSSDKVATSKKPATLWKSGRKPNEKWDAGFVEWHRQRLNKSDYWRNAGGAMKGDAIASLRQFEKSNEIQDKWEAYLEWLDVEQGKERDRQALQAAIDASYEIQDEPQPTQPQPSGFSYANKLNARLNELKAEGMPHKQAFETAKAELNQLAVA